MRISGLIFLFLGCLIFTAASAPAWAEAVIHDAETETSPEGGFADDGGRKFHGLKTMDIPLSEDAAHHDDNYSDDHHAADAHGSGHEKKAGLPQFDPSSFPSQIFWLVLAFGILYFFFSRKTLPEIGKVLQRRQAHIEHDIATAQKLRENAEEAKARYERAVAEAQDKATKLYLKAEAEAKAKAAAGMEEFKNRSALQVQDTEDYIQKAKKEAMESIQAVAAEVASLAAKKIVGISTDIDQAKSVVRNINKKAA